PDPGTPRRALDRLAPRSEVHARERRHHHTYGSARRPGRPARRAHQDPRPGAANRFGSPRGPFAHNDRDVMTSATKEEMNVMNQLQATRPARGGPAAFSATATIDTPGHAVGTSPQVYAKIAGVIWLIVALLAPFGEFFVRQGLIVPGNVAATAEKIVPSQLLFRAGFATDLVVFVIDVALPALLYVLFRPVSLTLVLVMAFARLAIVTIQ